jgi:hypothetical protein
MIQVVKALSSNHSKEKKIALAPWMRLLFHEGV